MAWIGGWYGGRTGGRQWYFRNKSNDGEMRRMGHSGQENRTYKYPRERKL